MAAPARESQPGLWRFADDPDHKQHGDGAIYNPATATCAWRWHCMHVHHIVAAAWQGVFTMDYAA